MKKGLLSIMLVLSLMFGMVSPAAVYAEEVITEDESNTEDVLTTNEDDGTDESETPEADTESTEDEGTSDTESEPDEVQEEGEDDSAEAVAETPVSLPMLPINQHVTEKVPEITECAYQKMKIEQGIYTLFIYDTKNAVSIPASSLADGAGAKLMAYSFKQSQQYRITMVQEGWYTIENVLSGKVLSIAGNSAEAGVSVVQKPYAGEDGQLWKFYKALDSHYYIVSKFDTVLDCSGDSLYPGAQIEMGELDFAGSQTWRLELSQDCQAAEVAEGKYQLEGVDTGSYVVVPENYSVSDSAAMIMRPFISHAGEQFTIKAVGNGWYTVVNVRSGKALTAVSGEDGAAVTQEKADGRLQQQWRFIDAGSGAYYVQSRLGTMIQRTLESGVITPKMYTKNNSDAQKWYLGNIIKPAVTVIESGSEYLITTALNEAYVMDLNMGSSLQAANVQLWMEGLAVKQRFRAVEIESGWYKLECVCSGLVLDILGNSKEDGANVLQNYWNGTDTQLWRFVDAGDGYSYIQSKTGHVLEADGTKAKDGVNIQMGIPNQSAAQKFRMCNISAENYIHTTRLTDNKVRIVLYNPTASGLQGVTFATWSLENEQDDLFWLPAEKLSGNVWGVEVESRDYEMSGDADGPVRVHAFLNTSGGSKYVGEADFQIKASIEGWIYVNGHRRYRDEDGTLRDDVSDIFNPDSKQITVDRIKGIVTIYGYNSDTNAYDTPIKGMWCSVGNPISLTAAGTYRMGWQLKKKEMNASDGSYRCWASYVSQIYGAVYFHGVASDTPDLNTISASAFRNLGNPASHGCVRLAAIDARWIYYNTGTGTVIKVGDNYASPMKPVRYQWTGGSVGPDPTYI